MSLHGLTGRSSTVRRGLHYIQFQKPQIVIGAVDEVVDAVRAAHRQP
jgi:hypothetical protein